MVVVFQVVAELLVLSNYALTTIAVTPMALIMTGLGTQLGPEAALSRVADTLVGVVLGLLVAASAFPAGLPPPARALQWRRQSACALSTQSRSRSFPGRGRAFTLTALVSGLTTGVAATMATGPHRTDTESHHGRAHRHRYFDPDGAGGSVV